MKTACVIRASVAALLLFTAQSVAAATCESLSSMKFPDATVTSAQSVAAGAFKPAAGGRGGGNQADLPAFCQVAATLKPSADSDIKIEVWLPAQGWNGKFAAVGNGGWNGNIDQAALGTALRRGYAAASTDTGHAGGGGVWMQNQEKVIDYGYRAVHEMTVKAKAIINEFYGSPVKLAYFNGCSAGGRQGLKAAQKYPDDFDGIVAGAPALNATGRAAFSMYVAQNLRKEEGSYIPATKYAAINAAVLQACDGNDGVKDGVIENPLSCRFDPKVLECKAGQDPASCLTAPQVASVKGLYAPVKHPATGEILLSGLEPGSELSFQIIGGVQPLGTVLEAQKYVIHKDANWDFRTSTIAGDLAAARLADPDDALNASSTNLKPFFDRGGKLLIYHGFQDPQVPPQNSIGYYNKVVSGAGKGLEGTQIALYMAPGVNHCSGGPGPDTFDKMAAIESWVATGRAPESITAAHRTSGVVDRTRPLCQYPKVARYRGTGSTDEASNFACVVESATRSTR
jgi:feruloyl esterase